MQGDGCPDELLRDDSSMDDKTYDKSEYEDRGSSCSDEERVDRLAGQLNDVMFTAAVCDVIYEPGSVEYIQEALLACRSQISRDTLLSAKLGDKFLHALLLISNTFTSDRKDVSLFNYAQQEVDVVLKSLRASMKLCDDIVQMHNFITAFPGQFLPQQQEMQESITRYESLLYSLCTIDSVHCILGDVSEYYWDVE